MKEGESCSNLLEWISGWEGLEPEDVEDADGRALAVDHPAEGEQLVDAGHDVVKQPGDKFWRGS